VGGYKFELVFLYSNNEKLLKNKDPSYRFAWEQSFRGSTGLKPKAKGAGLRISR
jgi:hypothetical protein